MKVLAILSLLLVSSLCFRFQESVMRDVFQQWKLTHNKSYKAGHEEDHRFSVFLSNYLQIIQINQQQSDVELGLNEFADLTSEEFGMKYTGLIPKERKNVEEFNYFPSFPNSIDWRTKGAVTPVKNQGSCGSCWAFSAVGALEGLYFNKNNKLQSFSEQNFVDCVKDGCEGCNGGWMDTAFEYTANNGVETEADYPYKGRDQKCQFQTAKAVKINTGLTDVTANSTTALKEALSNGPVAVAIQADQSVFQFYKTGIIKVGCGAKLNHGVLAVGYDDNSFIVKNSWGTAWGNKGYVLIGSDGSANKGQGVCGILAAASFPK